MASTGIPLAIQQPKFDSSTDVLQHGLTMANLATATQLNQARLQEEKAKAQQMAEDREDQQAIQQEFLNPAHLKPDKDDPTHRVMDYDSLRGALAGKVRLRSLKQLDADHLQEVRAYQQKIAADKSNQLMSLQLDDAKNKAIGQEIQGLEKMSDADKPAYYAGARQRLQKIGADLTGLPETIPGDGSFNETLSAIAASHGYATAMQRDALRKQQAETSAAQEKRAQSESAAKDSKVEQEKKAAQRGEIDRIYLSSDPQTQAEHDAIVARIKGDYPAVAGEYTGIKFDPSKTAKIIHKMALTSEERDKSDQSAQTAKESQDTRLLINEQNNALRRDLASIAAGRDRGQTPNSKAVDDRQAKRDLNKLIEEEDQAAALRANLESAIRSNGKLYVDEKGKKIPMSAATKSDDSNADSLVEGMKTQYKALTSRLKRIAADKNSIGEGLGMQIGVPTSQIHAALDADLSRVLGSPASAPAKQEPSKAPPAAQPASAPPKPTATAPATGKPAADQPVHIKLPNGKIGQFPNQAALDQWAKDNHLTITK